jgi:HK97 gp10 family phage protein
MADGVEIRTNLPDFKRQVDAMGVDFERRAFRSGVAAAAQVFRKQAEKNAPVYQGPRRKRRIAGTLRRNILIKRLRAPKGTEKYYVGVRAGRQRPKKGAPMATFFLPFYWAWVEAGHRIVPRGGKLNVGGRRTRALNRERFDRSGGGRTQPVWYLRNAFQQQKTAALVAFSARVQQRIDKENAKRGSQ